MAFVTKTLSSGEQLLIPISLEEMNKILKKEIQIKDNKIKHLEKKIRRRDVKIKQLEENIKQNKEYAYYESIKTLINIELQKYNNEKIIKISDEFCDFFNINNSLLGGEMGELDIYKQIYNYISEKKMWIDNDYDEKYDNYECYTIQSIDELFTDFIINKEDFISDEKFASLLKVNLDEDCILYFSEISERIQQHFINNIRS
jgi:hypothetical protein